VNKEKGGKKKEGVINPFSSYLLVQDKSLGIKTHRGFIRPLWTHRAALKY
jgi:hypothetical protein